MGWAALIGGDKYTTGKALRVHDVRLRCVYVVALVLALVYVVIIQIVLQHRYAVTETPVRGAQWGISCAKKLWSGFAREDIQWGDDLCWSGVRDASSMRAEAVVCEWWIYGGAVVVM